MKKIILLLLILTFSFAFKENIKNNNKEEGKEIKIKKTKETKYVTAKSGLIYRNKPKGKRLGKFEFNEKVNIIEHTNIFQEIKSSGKTLKGEWVGAKKGEKVVYLFNGYLSNEKTKITPEIVKYFMEEKIWLSNEFKLLLEKTKLISQAYSKSEFDSDIAFSDENKYGLFSDKNLMEPNYYELEFSNSKSNNKVKILDINNIHLTLEKNDKQYTFIKSNIKTRSEYYKLGGIQTASGAYAREWIKENFKGKFLFKTDNDIINLDSKNISYYNNGIIDIMVINGKTYSIDKLIHNKYYLSEIAFDEDEIYGNKNGETATLTKE